VTFVASNFAQWSHAPEIIGRHFLPLSSNFCLLRRGPTKAQLAQKFADIKAIGLWKTAETVVNWPQSSKLLRFLGVWLICLTPKAAFSINWEQQSQRLLEISGTLLEGVPIGDPVVARFQLGLYLDASLLPKVNPTVGGKKEKVPAAPVHAVPTLGASGAFAISKTWKLTSGVSAGYLMPGAESLFGIKAKLSQWTAGGYFGVLGQFSRSFALTADLGVHLSNSTLKGGITSVEGNDEFHSKATILYFRPGFLMPNSGIWGNMLIGKKSTVSSLTIPEDNTKLETTDTLKDTFPFLLQGALGYTHKSTGLVAGAALLFVPARAYFPRVHLGWNYLIGDTEKASSGSKADTQKPASAAKSKKTPKKKRAKKVPK
jgi:hypothetical protein